MANETLLKFIFHQDIVDGFLQKAGKEPWQVVYAETSILSGKLSIHSALMEPRALKKAMSHNYWDLRRDQGHPGFVINENGEPVYRPFGNDEGIRPFVIPRYFQSHWDSYIEICEEFRLFHNLAEDKAKTRLVDFDEAGKPTIEVVKFEDGRVIVYWPYLRRFLAATQLYFALFVQSFRRMSIPIDQIPEDKHRIERIEEWMRYSVALDSDGDQTLSVLFGKVIVPPPPVEESGIWPYDKSENTQQDENRDVLFIVGETPEGKKIRYPANPDLISDGPDPPFFLTPVYFTKDVLQKYYENPQKYTVEDGLIRCKNLWVLPIDNNHPTHVVVFLGDLAEILPYAELLHWKAHNVPPPSSKGLSETAFRRSILAEFEDTVRPDLVFRNLYLRLNQVWQQQYGWPLFRDLPPEDQHIFEAFHIPVSDSPSELEQQILWLSKLLVDSLNEKKIAKIIQHELEEDEKSIRKFERFLKHEGFSDTKNVIAVFQMIQTLRSVGVAHRKGGNYRKALRRYDLLNKSNQEIMQYLIEKANHAMRLLMLWVESK